MLAPNTYRIALHQGLTRNHVCRQASLKCRVSVVDAPFKLPMPSSRRRHWLQARDGAALRQLDWPRYPFMSTLPLSLSLFQWTAAVYKITVSRSDGRHIRCLLHSAMPSAV